MKIFSGTSKIKIYKSNAKSYKINKNETFKDI